MIRMNPLQDPSEQCLNEADDSLEMTAFACAAKSLPIRSRKERGVVALEFLLVFPLVVAMLYAAAAYGVTFFSKYEMQGVVDRAAATALRVDRNRYSEADLGGEVVARASAVMEQGIAALPSRLQERMAGNESSGCVVVPVEGLELLRCSLMLDNRDSPLIPQLSFGFLGQFPPLPDSLNVEASIAF